MKIHRLKPSNKPKASIYIRGEKEATYYIDLFSHKFYTGQQVSPYWQPTMMYNLQPTDFNKVIFSGIELWIVSENAKQILESLPGKTIEFLPLIHRANSYKKISYFKQTVQRKIWKNLLNLIPEEPHYIAHILDVKSTEVLDVARSDFEHDETDGKIRFIKKIAFQPELVRYLHLFKINNPGFYFKTATFISDTFKTLIEENKLTGLSFSDVHESSGGSLVWDSEAEEEVQEQPQANLLNHLASLPLPAPYQPIFSTPFSKDINSFKNFEGFPIC